MLLICKYIITQQDSRARFLRPAVTSVKHPALWVIAVACADYSGTSKTVVS